MIKIEEETKKKYLSYCQDMNKNNYYIGLYNIEVSNNCCIIAGFNDIYFITKINNLKFSFDNNKYILNVDDKNIQFQNKSDLLCVVQTLLNLLKNDEVNI